MRAIRVIRRSIVQETNVYVDRLILHDQSLLGRDCNAIFGNEEKGDGEDAAGTRTIPFDLDAGVVYEYFRAYYLLRRNRQVSTRYHHCRSRHHDPRSLFACTELLLGAYSSTRNLVAL